MSTLDLYTELKGWQSAIGSGAGFIALLLGALFNYHLNRKRDERLRLAETISTASALYSEIAVMRQNLARMANTVGARALQAFSSNAAYDKHLLESLALPKPKLYPALASKVGMLEDQLALAVVRFYAQAETADTWLPRLQNDEERPYTYSVNYVLDPAIAAVTEVAAALRSIEDMAGITERASMPGLKNALSAQEIDRLRYDD